ncbi:MAG: phenylalanine--tRNA ligase subunit beta [Bacteroidia bacterium]|nr:phenylalanine--tRNA ligase subunit beta [Bacteroidia bacterium]
MKVSYNWLKSLLDFPYTPDELSVILTGLGLEIEGIEPIGGKEVSFEKVVTGEVLTVRQHPNADRLRCCTVSVGGPEILSIVCGAPNVAEGQKVGVAIEGAILNPTGSTEPLKIKKGKIRGEESQGMICAEDELGLGTNHDGIMVLPADTPLGVPLEKILFPITDTQLEVAITPNRIDAASHYGVARDISAYSGLPLTFPEIFPAEKCTGNNPVKITIADEDKCRRYSGIYIKGVTVTDSPEWLKEKLTAVGLRPINSVVDITNYVMMELGQPLHAFDADKIAGGEIIVRTLPETGKFVTLDEKERTIQAETDLMICDRQNPLCIAGVFGGLHSGVTTETRNIFLESAYFDATTVRKTAKRLGINTDSSFRFERGADPNMTIPASLRAVKLITEIAGGVPSEINEVKLAEFPPFEVELSIPKIQSLIGKKIPKAEIVTILHRLEMQTEEKGEDTLMVKVPQYRVDVQRPQDIAEDILRVYGFNNVAFSDKISFSPQTGNRQNVYRLSQQVCNTLSAFGLYEIWNNSLTSRKYASENAVEMLNPLSEELAVMRESLLWGALEVIQYNQNRQNDSLALYEMGKVYRKSENEGGRKYHEQELLGVWLTGAKHAFHWDNKAPETTLFTLTKVVEKLAAALKIQGEIRETNHPEMDYALEYVSKKQSVFVWGKVKHEAQTRMDLRNEVFYLVGDWAKMVKLYFEQTVIYQPLSLYPGISRDISMLIPEKETYENIRKAVLQVNPLIKTVALHDVYRGKNIAEGKKSYLISLFIQDENGTMGDSVADKIWEKVCKTLENRMGAEIRKG